MRRLAFLMTAALASALLLGALAPAASAAGPKDRFHPSAVTAPWANGEVDENPDNALDAYGLCRTSTTAGFPPFAYGVPSAGEVDAIVGDAVNASGSSNYGCTTPQNETTIAVNPTNPNNLVAGANDYRTCCDLTGLNDGTGFAYYSFDGGVTWSDVQLPGLTVETGGQGNFKIMDSAGDPVIAFGPDGTAYYANIVFSRVSPASGIAVSSSSDGGRTWSAPNMVAYSKSANFFNDKEWIAAGPDGRVVVTWTVFNSGAQGAGYIASPIVGAISYNRGQSWNRQGFPISDATHPYDQGSQVAFAPNGDLYVAYEGSAPSTGYMTDALVLARSTNDGLTWTNVELGRVYDDYDCYPVYADRQTLTNQHFRLNSYPSMSIDPTNGRIAIAWADDQGVGTCGTGGSSFAGTTAARVKLVSGTWGSFSAPAFVTPAGTDTVFPAVAAAGGRIVVSYYVADTASANSACHVKIPDSATGPGPFWEPSATSVCLAYAARVSTDGFAAERLLTSEPSNPYVQFANGSFIGDYSQAAMGTDGRAHAAWTDFRGRPGTNAPNQDVYVATVAP
jgi:hypothetical protein